MLVEKVRIAYDRCRMRTSRLVLALLVIPIAFGVATLLFREPQQLCFSSVTPGVALTIRAITVTSTHVPVAFSVPTGRSAVTMSTPDGTHADGTLTVFDAKSPKLVLDNTVIANLARVDFCNFMSKGDVYVVEQDGVLVAYRATDTSVEPTGFTLTRTERDGTLAPAKAIASPNGMYIASITWDFAANAQVLSVAEADGKNAVVLATLTPEQGEFAFDEFSWSSSAKVAYAEVTPIVDAPDADGNTREKTAYRMDVKTRIREAVHIVPVP